MKKLFCLAASAAAMLFAQGAMAQVDLQVYYDFGKDRQYVSSTFEMFKADGLGDTFVFTDLYFADRAKGKAGLSGAANGAYFEIERGINFWGETALKDLSAHIEYDGSTWGAGILCLGAKYCLHDSDFSNQVTFYLMYDRHFGIGSADTPLKFTTVWGCAGLFGLEGLSFKGFMDVWGNNSVFADGSSASWSLLAEPQLWYNLGRQFGVPQLNVGTEIELSYNFAGRKGLMCNPCLGVKWDF